MISERNDDLWNQTNEATGVSNFTENVINRTAPYERPPGIHLFRDALPTHSLLWRLGIIFAISGIVLLGSFIVLFGFSYTRRHICFRRQRRRQPQQMLTFENQLNVTGDENLESMSNTNSDYVSVHQSCTNSTRQWSRDDNNTRPRSRSNSRSRSLSPGSKPRSPPVRSTQKSGQSDLEDDLSYSGLKRLENARLAFREDNMKYAEYDATKERKDVDV